MVARPILKSPEELDKMRAAGRVVAEALRLVESMIAPRVDTLALDEAVEAHIRRCGGVPAFKGYPNPQAGVRPFPASICASINEEVVHGIPARGRRLAEGDLVSVDVGVELEGLFGDAAWTFSVGAPVRKTRKLLEAGREALERGVAAMQPNARLAEVSRAIQACAQSHKFEVVRKFVGHGIGRAMHEPPQVPNYATRRFPDRSVRLAPGAVLALEPMLNAGTGDVQVLEDGWTVVTRDRKPSVHFEHTVAVLEHGTEVFTDLKG